MRDVLKEQLESSRDFRDHQHATSLLNTKEFGQLVGKLAVGALLWGGLNVGVWGLIIYAITHFVFKYW